jgi:hypothetical protein
MLNYQRGWEERGKKILKCYKTMGDYYRGILVKVENIA